jgi:putative ABC transport system permease protein
MAREFTLFTHAVRNLSRRPTRSLILVVAIGLLVSVFVFALSFVRRVDTSIKKSAARLGADVLVVPTGSRGAAEDVLLDNRVKTFYMDRSIVERVKAVKGVARVTAETYLATLVGGCCDVPDAMVVAFDQDSDFVVGPWLARRMKRRLKKGEAVVGSESALNISLGLTEVNTKLFGSVFRIVGVLEKTGTGLDNAIFIDERSAEEVLRPGATAVPPGTVSVVFAKVEDGEDPRRVAGAIEDSIIEADAVARRDVGQNILRALGDIGRMFAITFLLAAILAGCLTWAVFSAVANERVREVGLMRAIGAKESHVVKLFLLEVILVGALGSAIGAVSGTGLSFAMGKGFAILKNVSSDLGPGDRLAVAALGLVVGTAICILGALLPIRSTRRTEPLVVLKGD